MSWSIRLLRVAGIEVRLHLTFFLLLAWIGWSYYSDGGAAAAVEGLLFILALFGCVLLHEFGHAFAARLYGIRTPDITLLPIGGVARIERMPDKPHQELVVALAGPAVNVVIAGVLILVLGLRADPAQLEQLANPTVGFGAKLAVVNIFLVLFNLIPAFPMDGGRVLRALLAMLVDHRRATLVAARTGQALAFVFGFLGLFGNPLLLLIALFVFLGASQENTAAQVKDLSGQLRVADAMMTELHALRPDETIGEAVEALLRTAQREFPVLEEDGQVAGVLTRDAMIKGLKESGPDLRVAAAMHRDLPALSVHQSFEKAFETMHTCHCPALPVVDAYGRFIGLITPENVGELMMVQAVRRDRGVSAGRRPLTVA